MRSIEADTDNKRAQPTRVAEEGKKHHTKQNHRKATANRRTTLAEDWELQRWTMAMRDLVSGAAACGDSSSSSANPLASLANALVGSSSKTQVSVSPPFLLLFLHSSLISIVWSRNCNRRGWRRFRRPLSLILPRNFTPPLSPSITFPAPNSISRYWMQTIRFGLDWIIVCLRLFVPCVCWL